MKKWWTVLSAALFALVLTACGDPADFEDMPEDEGSMMQEGNDSGTGGESGSAF